VSGAVADGRRATTSHVMQRRLLACLALATGLVSASGAHSFDPARVELVVSGRVLDMNGEPFVGALTVTIDVRSAAPEDWMYRLPNDRELFTVTTDADGRFAAQRSVDLHFVYYQSGQVLVQPHAHDGSVLERDAAVTNAFAALGWRAERAFARDRETVALELGEFTFAPAPAVARVRFTSLHPTLEVGAKCFTPMNGSGTWREATLRTVATNRWVEFHSWSDQPYVAFEGRAGPRETFFGGHVPREREREFTCTPTSSVTFAIGDELMWDGTLELFATSDGHARRLVEEAREWAWPDSGAPPVLHTWFRADASRTARPVRLFDALPDGEYRAAYRAHGADESEEPLAVADFTVPHVGWIALAPP